MTVGTTRVLGATSILLVLMVPGLAFTADAQDNDVTVCVGADSILRSPESGICASGSQQFKVSGPGISKVDATDGDPTAQPDESEAGPLAAIEDRLNKLETSSVFEVVDTEGRVIFSVAPGRVYLYNSDGAVVAALGTTAEGGAFSARTPDAKLTAFIRALGDRVDLRINEGELARLALGRGEAGNYSLQLPLGDKVIAGVGESKAGTGALVVGDAKGPTRAAMEVNDGKGALNVFNLAGHGVASLTESVGGGGLLVLTDANSNATVMMKTNDNRYGVVMALPPGLPYVPKSGLPGSYMLGCAGGPSCVP